MPVLPKLRRAHGFTPIRSRGLGGVEVPPSSVFLPHLPCLFFTALTVRAEDLGGLFFSAGSDWCALLTSRAKRTGRSACATKCVAAMRDGRSGDRRARGPDRRNERRQECLRYQRFASTWVYANSKSQPRLCRSSPKLRFFYRTCRVFLKCTYRASCGAGRPLYGLTIAYKEVCGHAGADWCWDGGADPGLRQFLGVMGAEVAAEDGAAGHQLWLAARR